MQKSIWIYRLVVCWLKHIKILSLSLSIVLSFLFIGNYKSIGFVTVIGVFFMGNLTGYFVDSIREKIGLTNPCST